MSSISLGVATWRDGERFRAFLESLVGQAFEQVRIREAFVMTPNDNIGLAQAALDEVRLPYPVQLLNEGRRAGKHVAVNMFLKSAASQQLVLCSGDIVLDSHAIEQVCRPLRDQAIGIVAARPLPLPEKHALSDVLDTLWTVHHSVSLMSPKFGEMLAFRNVGIELPQTAVDEEAIAALILARGYRAAYSESALVYNAGPRCITDFLSQRRRIYCGHLQLGRSHRHRPLTLDSLATLRLATRAYREGKVSARGYLLGLPLEAASRLLGYADYLRDADHSRWSLVERS